MACVPQAPAPFPSSCFSKKIFHRFLHKKCFFLLSIILITISIYLKTAYLKIILRSHGYHWREVYDLTHTASL